MMGGSSSLSRGPFSDRPPTAVGSPGCSASESAKDISFETATLLKNPRRKGTSKSLSLPSTGGSDVPQTSTSSYMPPQRTPDPIRLSAAKKARELSNKMDTTQKSKKTKSSGRSTSSSMRTANVSSTSTPMKKRKTARKIVVDTDQLPNNEEEDLKTATQDTSEAQSNHRELEPSA
ncbi:hypothetical protein GCK32_018010 [Trichostrongylus colubriformis]|uniref:Uncharacterized protein n=1 Tax=Trichostrongylus colubriformis TaxID=6319 RepID=A0AAN8F774_TRICO